MKKTLAIALALVCCLGLLAACGEPASDPSEAPASEAPASEAPASEAPSSEPIELSGTIVVNGSTSMGDVINALTEGFNELHPDVQISYTGSGSSAGIEAALAGSCDLGLSSRELSDDELSQGAVANVIAKDGVAVVVNPENPVTELTSEQIAKIFTGEITNWSELGGNDEEILIISREAGSGTRSAFEEICGLLGEDEEGNEISLVDESKALIADSTNAVSTNVVSHTNAIGYISLGSYDSTQVHAINVGGVECTEENIVAGTYPIARPFLLVQGPATDDLARAFLDYILSADGQAVVSEQGYIPVA